MCTNNNSQQLPLNSISNNIDQGSYRPFFFDLAELKLSRVEYSTSFFDEGAAEINLLNGNFSFCYLREDKLRKIDVYDESSSRIRFDEFLERFGIKIKSKNLFKTGKYISRILRPVKYGGYFKNLDVHINLNPAYAGKVTDGLSLISINLAKRLGWSSAAANKSAQFTFFSKLGLVKGHCVVSSQIDHDLVIYGHDNIKNEICLDNELQYITLEPVKLGKTLRLDFQSLLNLWQMFGPEQYLSWAYSSISRYKEDLFSGKLSDWLDDFDEIEVSDFENEQWLLKKAIWKKVEYWRYPGLVRQAWSMFRNSMQRFGEKLSGDPSFRIPVPSAKRGYIRVDLRNHDQDGNFTPTVKEGNVTLDDLGNLWIHPADAEEFLYTLGGGDMDDAAAVIPIVGNCAVIFRNPNQYSEVVIRKISYEGIKVSDFHELIGSIKSKKYSKDVNVSSINSTVSSPNKLLNKFMAQACSLIQYEDYTLGNLLRRLTMITSNRASVGVSSNAEMIRSTVGIRSKTEFNKLCRMFNWNLEHIIDATVKEGVDCKSDMEAVRGLVNYVVENKIPMPKAIVHRFSEKLRTQITQASKHPLDELLDAIKQIVDNADLEVLGKGCISKSNRIAGRIDRCDVPVIELGLRNLSNPLADLAISIQRDYNKRIAILLDTAKDDETKNAGIQSIQLNLLNKLNSLSLVERQYLINAWAYEIYRSPKLVNDSVLWVRSTGELRGTAEDMLSLISDVGLAMHIKKNGCVKRVEEIKIFSPELLSIRVWSKEEITQEIFAALTTIEVVGKEVIAGSIKINLGDENTISDGCYSIREVTQAYSRKNGCRVLKNSLTILLQN